MNRPALTVLIDTYNHERFIEQAIVSVLEQDFPSSDREILVVDDGSTDRTPEIVRKFEPRIRLIQKANGGQASAFNAGIPEARGAIVSFLDGDDWWAPTKLTRVVEAMEADPAVGIVGNGIVMVQQDGREQTEILREGFHFRADTLEGARLFRLRRSFLGTSRMTIRADLLQRIGPVPEAILVQADEYLFTLAATLSKGQVLSDALTYYRYHDANGYQVGQYDPARLRRKQEAIATLARSLSTELGSHGIPPEAQRAIIEILQAEADQLRLALDGGAPLETMQAEWTIYDTHHLDAPTVHRIFKRLSLIPAIFLSPQTYYRLRDRLVRNQLYRHARERLLPNPQRRHVVNEWRPKPENPGPAAGVEQ